MLRKAEREVARLTKIRDDLDMVFGTICIILIITAAVICPVMVNL